MELQTSYPILVPKDLGNKPQTSTFTFNHVTWYCRQYDDHVPIPGGEHYPGWFCKAAGDVEGECVQAGIQGDDYLRSAVCCHKSGLPTRA